jgi:hypothetical protein
MRTSWLVVLTALSAGAAQAVPVSALAEMTVLSA